MPFEKLAKNFLLTKSAFESETIIMDSSKFYSIWSSSSFRSLVFSICFKKLKIELEKIQSRRDPPIIEDMVAPIAMITPLKESKLMKP